MMDKSDLVKAALLTPGEYFARWWLKNKGNLPLGGIWPSDPSNVEGIRNTQAVAGQKIINYGLLTSLLGLTAGSLPPFGGLIGQTPKLMKTEETLKEILEPDTESVIGHAPKGKKVRSRKKESLEKSAQDGEGLLWSLAHPIEAMHRPVKHWAAAPFFNVPGMAFPMLTLAALGGLKGGDILADAITDKIRKWRLNKVKSKLRDDYEQLLTEGAEKTSSLATVMNAGADMFEKQSNDPVNMSLPAGALLTTLMLLGLTSAATGYRAGMALDPDAVKARAMDKMLTKRLRRRPVTLRLSESAGIEPKSVDMDQPVYRAGSLLPASTLSESDVSPDETDTALDLLKLSYLSKKADEGELSTSILDLLPEALRETVGGKAYINTRDLAIEGRQRLKEMPPDKLRAIMSGAINDAVTKQVGDLKSNIQSSIASGWNKAKALATQAAGAVKPYAAQIAAAIPTLLAARQQPAQQAVHAPAPPIPGAQPAPAVLTPSVPAAPAVTQATTPQTVVSLGYQLKPLQDMVQHVGTPMGGMAYT
jgi:hypothetical protein